MTGSRVFLTAISLAAVTACGLAGGTRPFVVEFEATDERALVRRVTLDSFEIEKEAAIRFSPENPGVTIGAFGEDDREILAQSVEDSLVAIDWPPPTTIEEDLKLHIVLRRHVVAAGLDMAVLAIVAWAIVDSDGKLIYHEQFYATVHSENIMWTMGYLKDRANQVIARRVVGSSLVIAAGKNIDEFLPYEGTFVTLGEAKETVPSEFSIPKIAVPGQNTGVFLGVKTSSLSKTIYEGTREEINWDQYDKTVPLNWGARVNPLSPLTIAASKGYLGVVKRLLGAGANIEYGDKYRQTPLMSASYYGHLQIAGVLLDAGADVNARSTKGHTPLSNAAHQGQSEVVRLLIEHGAKIDAKDDEGKDALATARERGHTQVIAILAPGTVEPSIEAASEDAEILEAVDAAVTVAKNHGFGYDDSDSKNGRVVVNALWKGRPVTLTMRFFRKESGLHIASRLSQPGDVALAGGGQKVEQAFYPDLLQETTRRGITVYGDPDASP